MDYTIVLYLNQLTASSPILSGAVVIFAHYLPWLVSAAFIVFVLVFQKANTTPPQSSPQLRGGGSRIKLITEGIGAAVLAWLGSQFIRLFIHRPRPFVADPSILALIEKTSYSFPSGHAAFFFALSTVVFLYNRRWGVWFFAASALIGLARIMAGVHYPTDILGGAVLGVAVGYVVARLFRHVTV